MSNFYSGLRRFFAVLIGSVFFVSGILKLMDPVGTSLIVSAYLDFFKASFAAPWSKVIAMILAYAETLTGVMLLSGLARKIVAIITFALIGFFTVITLALLIANPEMDCGCFGEALHLTHFQSFAKNLVLCALAAVAFIPLQDGYGPRKTKYFSATVVTLAVVLFGIYSLRRLPLVDFTALAPGAELSAVSADSDAGAATLSLRDPFGQYSDEVASSGDVVIISAYDPEALGVEEWAAVSELSAEALSHGMRPVVLAPYIEGVPMELGEYLYFSDYKTIITLNRSNGGVTWLSDGLIVLKWPSSALPDSEAMDALMLSQPQEEASSAASRGRVSLESILLASFAILLLV